MVKLDIKTNKQKTNPTTNFYILTPKTQKVAISK